MIDPREIARLREAFAADAGTAPEGCVEAEAIWAAVHGEAPPATVRAVIEHTAACASCAEAWRLAMAVSGSRTAAQPARRGSWLRPLRVAALAAAAAVVVVVGGTLWRSRPSPPPEPPVFREAERAKVESRLAAGEVLSRARCELKWTPVGGPGTTYEVTVSTPDLRVLASAAGLAEPAFQVPADALAGLPRPATLLWRVEATLPDGPRVTSPTFTTAVE